MRKTLQLVEIYVGIDRKSYLLQLSINFILCIAFLFAIGEFAHIEGQKQVISNIGNLVRIDSLIVDEDQLTSYMEQLDQYINPKAKIVATYKKTVYTTELYYGDRIILDIKNKDFIQHITMRTSKGNWFSDVWEKQEVLQAVVPKSLSNKYKLGKQYVLNLDTLSSNINNVKVEIVGVLENDMIYDMSYNDYIIIDDSRILIYDSNKLFQLKNYNLSDNVFSFLIKLDTTYDNFFDIVKSYDNVINIKNIEKSLLNQLTVQKPDMVLPMIMAISILSLLFIYIISKNLLYYMKNYNKLDLYLRLGCTNITFIKIFIVLTLGETIIPLFLGHLTSILGKAIHLYYYFSYHILYVSAIIFTLYFAIVVDPSLILADEPTGALDVKSTNEIIELLRKINDLGTTIILVTHNPVVSKNCYREIVLSDGKIIN